MICYFCKHFSAGWRDTRTCPGEPDECGHPKLFVLMSANMARGAIRKCKGYESKHQITYRQVEKMDNHDPMMLAFMAQENNRDAAMANAGSSGIHSAHNDPGSLAEFNRYIAGDR